MFPYSFVVLLDNFFGKGYNRSMYDKILIIYAIYLAATSVTAFAFYAADKMKARKGLFRIPEKTLLALSFFGGAAGGTIAMMTLKHKTHKRYFKTTNALGLIWQIALAVFLISKSTIVG